MDRTRMTGGGRRRLGGIPEPMRNRAFAVYWAGGFLSNMGTWLQSVAASVYVYQLTGSPLSVGFLNFASFLPVLLFSVWGGVVSDRLDRRLVVIVASIVAAGFAAVLAAVTFAGEASEAVLVIVAFAINFAYAFAKPALSALLPALVPEAEMSDAVSLNSLQFVSGQLVGPVIATLVLATWGAGWAFAINAVTFVGPVLVMLYLLRAGIGGRLGSGDRVDAPGGLGARGRSDIEGEASGPSAAGAGLGPERSAPSREPQRRARGAVFGRGAPGSILTFILAQPWVATALVGVVCTSAFLELVRTLSPVLAATVLHVPDSDAGLIVAAQSAGSAIGLVGFVPLRRWVSGERLALVGLLVQGLAVLGVAASGGLADAGLAVAANGFGFALCFPVMTGILQGDVPDRVRGRVMSLHTIANLGNRPATALAAGSIAAVAGAPVAMVAGIVLVPVGLLAVRRTWSGSRHEAVSAGSAA
ncbi:MAG TPA: MFS transporter [Candidatus Limnocylindrales bacterium]|nr:MFS transporter [Candidatus Limnocylindrales bacterium]